MSRVTIALLLVAFASVARSEDQVYFGLLHGHTHFSDGSGTPEEAFTMAKEAGLDFMAITEHNHDQAAGQDGVFLTPDLYGTLIQTAREHSVPGEFLAIWGQEFSTISSSNHLQIFYANEICDVESGDMKSLYEEWLPDHGEVPFIQFNHPGVREDQRASTPENERNNDYGIDDYEQDFGALVAAAGQHVALIELIIGPAFAEPETGTIHHNGVHETDYKFYLNQGFRLAPSVGQDNHNKTWGTATHARMGIWAEELTHDAIMDAIRARRCYASEDDNAVVSFSINGSPMGSTIPLDSSTVELQVTVQDEDEPDAKHRVRIFYDDAVGGDEATVIENQLLDAGETEATFVHAATVGGYYFAKVTQTSDHNDDIWTAPIWVGAELVFNLAEVPVNTDDPQKQEIDWTEATNYVGHEVTVSGQIIRSYNHQDTAVFFNFDEDYENTLTLIILKSDFDAFGGLEKVEEFQRDWVNNVVTVKGEITLYLGERLQVRLRDQSQIVGVNPVEE